MFVRSRMDKPVTFRKGGKSWILAPHSVTLIDDPTVTAKELKCYYGSKIDVISNEGIYEGSEVGRQPIKSVVKSKTETTLKNVEKPVKKVEIHKVDEKSLDDILDQVNKELKDLDDNKEVDTAKGSKPIEVKPVEPANDTKPKDKDSEDNLAPSNAAGNTKAEAKKEEKKTKPARARRTTSNKTKAKRATSKKTTKK